MSQPAAWFLPEDHAVRRFYRAINMARIKKFRVGIVEDVCLQDGRPVLKCRTDSGVAIVELNDFDIPFVCDRLAKVKSSLDYSKKLAKETRLQVPAAS